MIVPFNAGNLTRFATNTCCDVDVLANLCLAARALTRNRSGMGRNLLYLKCSWITHCTRSLLDLFQFHEEPLELGCKSIRINRGRGKLISRIPRSLARILSNTAVAPVDRDADL